VTDSTDIHFDGWTLDRASGELSRDGKTQRLPPQPLAMLVTLLDRAGEVVTREALVQVLWPKGIVDFDNSLNAVVRKLRTALGDDPEKPRYIETLPRIGYRFIGKLGTAPAVPAAAPPPSVPTRVPWISRGPTLMAIALVVVGVVAWLQWPDREVRSALPPAADSAHPRRTTNERAHDHYLQGIFNRSRRDINGTQLALSNFDAALKEDPHYADAWAGLAETLSGAAMTQTMPTVQTYDRAKSAALRAIELDDALAHGHAALAHIRLMYDRDLGETEAELELAMKLDPNYSRNWHTRAILRAFQNRLPEALDAIRRARELEPMTLLYSSNYGLLLYNSRRFEEAVAHAKSLLGSQPRNDQARSLLIRALVASGRVDEALEQLPLRVSEKPNLADAGFVYAHAGHRANALAEVARIERIGAEGFGVGYDIAIIQAALGDLPAACAALERTLSDHSLVVMWMRTDPRMDPMRGQPCYAEVAKRLYGD
jgi:DNA-binding winged helix-turn-helix (wHTH) protein/tetratricopeptide (TPR) repeat protein